MFRNVINNIKLSKLSYLLEIIEVRDFRSKINAYNKIKRMKITKEMGLQILDSINYDHTDAYSDFNISLSLISLIFNDYYDEYSDKLKELFPKMTDESKYEILNLLSCSNNESAILLYRDLVIKYIDTFDNVPIGTLSSKPSNYSLLFPELFKALKGKVVLNNVLLIFNDFLNSGVVLEADIKKNKKLIQTSVTNILKEGCNYKFSKNENIMQNKVYITLRIFLEVAVNIEFYVSNKQTKKYLDRLYKKKDNQLKLFVLDNYVRKNIDISKYSLNTIAKDELSRYPLYSFLKYYGKDDLMPKKYANNKALSESDLFINYSLSCNYNVVPFDFQLIEERIIDDHKYYIYRFKTKYNYLEEVKDPATDYILSNSSIDKSILSNTIIEYIGISGGFNKDLDPSIIEVLPKVPLVSRFEEDQETEINKLVSLIVKPSKDKTTKEEKVGFISKIKNKFKKKEKPIEEINKVEEETKVTKEETKIKEEVTEVKEEIKETKEEVSSIENIPKEEKISFIAKLKSKFKKKEKVEPKIEKVVKTSVVEEEEEYKKPSILRRIFSLGTLLVIIFILFLGSFLVLLSYIFDMDIFDLKNTNMYDTVSVTASKLEKDNFTEIPYQEIFSKDDPSYYVLFFNKEEKSVYYTYLNKILDNDYKFYYVDLSKEENSKIKEWNETSFVVTEDALLKVKDKVYDFYIFGKNNIVKEFKSYIDQIEEAKEEAERKRIEEEAKKSAEKQVEE